MNIEMINRKTSNYNADIVIKNDSGEDVVIAIAYATFTTGESINKYISLQNEQLYIENQEVVNNMITQFSLEVEELAKFHNVPIV